MREVWILVVDDEPNVVNLCQRLLERAGFHVVATTSPSQALAILTRRSVDLMLLDIRMPGLDGFQLITLARHHRPELAIVIMTAFGTVETAISAMREGANGLILKPFENADLVQTVRRALDESEQRRDLNKLRALRPLLKISETLFSETDILRLHGLIVEMLAGILNCSEVALFQRSKSEENFCAVGCVGDISPFEEMLREYDNLCLLEKNGLPVLINNDGSGDQAIREIMLAHSLGSLIFVQVPNKQKSYFLFASRRFEQPVFRDGDLEMFAIMSRGIGQALENAILYHELRLNFQQLEQSQHALNRVEKMAAAGRLTASIAHEINNPLQSLQNCMHLAGRKELTEQERQNYLQVAQDELERLMAIVQRMLEFYRPGVRDPSLVDINTLINRVEDLLAPQLNKNKIKINKQMAPEIPGVMVVADQVQQVFINLILNSMEAMPEGGEIFIQSAPFYENLENPGVEILIEDTGNGIPEGEKDHIFEPFVSTKEHGTGLGLAVSYGIVTAHGGSINLIQGKGKGACFRIFLPEEN
jgi:signal transduction histidine kinase/FixJ family two-component response regulator